MGKEEGKGAAMPWSPNHSEAPKSTNSSASTFVYTIQYIYSQKTLCSNMGAPKTSFLPWAPAILGTLLLPSVCFDKDMIKLIYEKSDIYSRQKIYKLLFGSYIFKQVC